MRTRKTIYRLRLNGIFMALLLFGATPAHALSVAQTPLFLTSGAEPNIMFLVDTSGSMQNVVVQAPYDPDTTYLATCTNNVPTDESVELRIVSSGPRLRYNNTNYAWGTGTSQRCFTSTATYMAKLHADSGTSPSNYLPAAYSGNYLNWYFNAGNTIPVWNAGQRLKPGVPSRMQVARQATHELVGSLNNVRVGLARYSDAVDFTDSTYLPAHILSGVANIETNRSELLSAVATLTASGLTPLAESLHSIGRYFVQGHDQPLTLHPGWSIINGYPYNPSTHSAYSVFDTQPTYAAGVAQVSPIQHSCQKSFAVVVTDGRPQADRALSGHSIAAYRDYDGDCIGASPACLSFDTKEDRSYESRGSDYFDDVAYALHDIDLRPDLLDFEGDPVKNNLSTYVIGFAEDSVLDDPLLQEAAEQGGGAFFVADNAAGLVSAFTEATQSIFSQVSSSSSVAANSTRLDGDTEIYQARFNSADWSGQLRAYPLLGNGSVSSAPKWDASELVPAADSRLLLTYNPDSGGVTFTWANLSADQRTALNTNSDGEEDGLGEQRVAWLRGSAAQEQTNGGPLRNRTNLLGDFINSDPFFVHASDFGFSALPYTEASSYAAFRQSNQSRTPMIYIGGNGGKLHGFNATAGVEVFAFIPNAVYHNLSHLTDPDYKHRYYVDGSPRAVDAFIDTGDGQGAKWRTVLIGSTGAGGRSVFALDVTDPQNPAVMWEYTHNELGVTIGQPTIVRTKAGWMAVFGNGYNSASGRARLFVVNLADGTLANMIATSTDTTNGLATPTPYDAGRNRVTTAVYAGDLRGSLWKFDLDRNNASTFGVAYTQGGTPEPLFKARDQEDNEQPITARPAVGSGPPEHPSAVMVYFGTGRYFAQGDSSNTSEQSFYGVLDSGTRITTGRGALQEQTIDAELFAHGEHLRVGSQTDVNWSSQRGWFIDLLSPTSGAQGERVVSTPILRHGRIIFVTLIPDPDPCAFGGTGWLMEMSALTGGRLDYSPFDLNEDGNFNEDDYVSVTIDGETIKVPVSGKRSNEGIIKPPGIVGAGDIEYKYTSGSSGNIEVTIEKGSDLTGRQSWRQMR